MWLLPDILVCIKGSGDVYTKPRVRETYAFHRRNLVLQLLSHILHPFHLPSNSRFDVAMGYSFSSRRLDDGHLLFLDAIMLESSPSLVEVHRCNVEASSIGHRTPAVRGLFGIIMQSRDNEICEIFHDIIPRRGESAREWLEPRWQYLKAAAFWHE